MNYTFATVVVTAAVAANLQELSRRLDKGNCGGMFVAKLSATGSLPATHFVSSGLVPNPYLNAITNNVRLYTLAKRAWEDDGDVFPYTQLQVTNALSKCSLSDGTIVDGNGDTVAESPFDMIARLGLKQINDVA